jgi:hypothetical protein
MAQERKDLIYQGRINPHSLRKVDHLDQDDAGNHDLSPALIGLLKDRSGLGREPSTALQMPDEGVGVRHILRQRHLNFQWTEWVSVCCGGS